MTQRSALVSPRDGRSPETYRLFIAISLPEHVKNEIERAQEELRGAGSRDCVGWTRRAQLHLTLKFLGNVEPRCVDALTNALGLACERCDLLPLCAGRIGVFPDMRRPRLIWAGQNRPRPQRAWARWLALHHAVRGAASAPTVDVLLTIVLTGTEGGRTLWGTLHLGTHREDTKSRATNSRTKSSSEKVRQRCTTETSEWLHSGWKARTRCGSPKRRLRPEPSQVRQLSNLPAWSETSETPGGMATSPVSLAPHTRPTA
jgi:LigT like Phosphoesterase